MAGWSILRNGSALDCADNIDCCSDANHAMNDSGGIDVDDFVNDDEAKIRCLFDEVLSISLNEAASRGCIRPLPALLSDGKPLDLFELFMVVRKRGGFDLVNGFWTFVAKELGLDLGDSVSVKLMYFKYLYELERWLSWSFREERLGNRELELEAKFKFLLSNKYNQKNGNRYATLDHKKNGKYIDGGVEKREIGKLDTKNARRVCDGVRNRHGDDDEKILKKNKKYHNGDPDDLVILDPSTCKQEFSSRKRKRESLSKMLRWVIKIARCPQDPLIGEIPPLSKWKERKGQDLWVQAIRARDALLQRKWDNSNPEQPSVQNNQKMHPSMYDNVDLPIDHSMERLRCSERILSLVKNRPCSCCNSCSSSHNKATSCPKKEFENDIRDNISASATTPSPPEDENLKIRVLVGPRYQAEVPEWSGVVSEGDSKWLGTRVWPVKYGDHNSSIEMVHTGKGRPGLCDCKLPGSVECVRFHIAEKRMKLKLEIGPVFFHWRFDRMGEEVCLRWTMEEEKRFKDMVTFNPPFLGKCFWDYACKYFPRKTREELVSYYFNVFLVRRRSYQNRVTPKNIDSDDDESEFGCLGESFGHVAVSVPGATTMSICSENKQCTDFE